MFPIPILLSQWLVEIENPVWGGFTSKEKISVNNLLREIWTNIKFKIDMILWIGEVLIMMMSVGVEASSEETLSPN